MVVNHISNLDLIPKSKMKTNTIEKWIVEIEDFPSDIFVNGLYDDFEGFRILVKGGNNSRIYRISFDSALGYRNFDESERLNMLNDFPTSKDGWSLFKTKDSEFIDWIVKESFEVHVKREEITHYYIVTPNDIIEILSTTLPSIERM